MADELLPTDQDRQAQEEILRNRRMFGTGDV